MTAITFAPLFRARWAASITAVVCPECEKAMMTSPDRPRKGETLPGSAWSYKAGGKGGNQAVAAAQFGVRTSMVGRVGNDDFGGRLLNNLKTAGIDTEHVRTDLEAGSGMSVAIIDAEGDYGAVIVSGANLRLSNEDLEEAREVIRNAQVLVLQNEVPEATNVAAAKLAKGYGVRVVFNAAPARPLGPDLAANIDLLVVNAVEAEMICGVVVASLRAAAEAAAILSNQVAAVVVTAGGLGLAVAAWGETPYAEAAHPVKLVDTHGAGDVLIGALAARWASGVPVPEAVHFANAAAALFVSTPSDQKKVVTSDQVTRFLFGRLFQSLFAKSGTRVTENSAAVHFGMRPQQRSQMFSTTFSLGETAHHEFLLRTRLNLQPILSRIGFCLTRLALRT